MTTRRASATAERAGHPDRHAMIAEPRKINPLLRLVIWGVERELQQRFVPGRLMGWAPRMAIPLAVVGWFGDYPGQLRLGGGAGRAAEQRLLSLVSIAASLAAGSPYCVAANAGTQPAGVTAAEIEALLRGTDVSQVPTFTPRERLAVSFARHISSTPLNFPDDFLAELTSTFDPREIVTLASVAAAINYQARLIEALGVPAPAFKIDTRPRSNGDGWRALVVYESMLGATHEVADAVARGLRAAAPAARVELIAARDAGPEVVREVDLLIVGAPTHFQRLPSRLSRFAARRDAGSSPSLRQDALGPGVREWLRRLPSDVTGHAAAFDTRLDVWKKPQRLHDAPPATRPSRFSGGAANGIARRLRRLGYRLVAGPEGFFVYEGEDDCPLREAERERAESWGRSLIAGQTAPRSGSPNGSPVDKPLP